MILRISAAKKDSGMAGCHINTTYGYQVLCTYSKPTINYSGKDTTIHGPMSYILPEMEP
jgi:hypothetical protein